MTTKLEEKYAEVRFNWNRLRRTVLLDFAYLKHIGLDEIARYLKRSLTLKYAEKQLEEFLKCDGLSLSQIHGFSLSDIKTLTSLLQDAILANQYDLKRKCLERESARGNIHIDPSFPTHLMGWSSRIIDFLEAKNISTLGELLVFLNSKDLDFSVNGRSLRLSFCDELLAFLAAYEQADVLSLKQWLPDLRSEHLDLNVISFKLEQLDSKKLKVLNLRFAKGETLDGVAKIVGSTAITVRQVEQSFLKVVRSVLEWCPEKRDYYQRRWMKHKKAIPSANTILEPAKKFLVNKVISSIFEKSSLGQVRKMADEQLLNELYQRFTTDPMLHLDGVDLACFLAANVRHYMREAFQEKLYKDKTMEICLESGAVKLVSRTLKSYVKAYLQLERFPRPIESIICLVGYAEDFKEVPNLTNKIQQWCRNDPTFPADKIIF